MSTSENEQPREERRISDAQTMRALSHPVRIEIWEALSLGGPMTATQVGERIGESPTTCSFHLRQLQKYGFVEEAGGGQGRSRPWKIAHFGISFSTSNDDPETEVASSALARLFRERQQSRYRTWVETRNTFPAAWREAAGETEAIMYCTAEELELLNNELRALVVPRFSARITNPELRPPGAVAVEMHLTSFPIEHPGPDPEQSG
jgi:DNA-binding transcriptional ArsR family regulator